jgi:DNA-binding transcriptional LysR family regulator
MAGNDLAEAALKTSSASAICHLVAAGRGISIVSTIVAREHEHLAIEIRPLKPRREQPVYLLKSRHRIYSPLVEMLADQIANNTAGRKSGRHSTA